MSYTAELDFARKVLNIMQIDSQIVNISQIPHSVREKIIRKNTLCIISDEFMCNYILFILPENTDNNIFICGPYDNTEVTDEPMLFALFSALGEYLWKDSHNFTIKKYTTTDDALYEVREEYTHRKYCEHVKKAMSIVDADLTADLSLNAVSSILGINESYFSSLFRKETGKTFTDYVNGKRIENAKKLLLSTSLQIQTIAQHCGILDVNYFTKLFKKYTGFSPSSFRNST